MRMSAMVLLSAFLMSAASPVFATTPEEKVICNLAAQNCLDKSKILEKRIKKIQKDLKSGKSYSPEEMKMLEQKLQETMDQLDKVEGKK